MPDSTKVVRYGWDDLSIEERTADSAIDAGDLVERTATGVQSHSTDGGHLDQVLVAQDDRAMGYEAGDTLPSGDLIRMLVANSGVGLHLNLAAGSDLADSTEANISEGDRLVSAGDGTVRQFDDVDGDVDTDVVAIAEEAVDNSGAAAGEDTPLAVEVVR